MLYPPKFALSQPGREGASQLELASGGVRAIEGGGKQLYYRQLRGDEPLRI